MKPEFISSRKYRLIAPNRGKSQVNKLPLLRRAEVLIHTEARLLSFDRETWVSILALAAVGIHYTLQVMDLPFSLLSPMFAQIDAW